MRSNTLRKLIYEALNDEQFRTANGIKSVYANEAPDSAKYPRVIFSIEGIDTGDLTRKDYDVIIDVYDKDIDKSSTSSVNVENIGDAIEDLLSNSNRPKYGILPTFFVESSRNVIDPDIKIKHRQISVIAQLYKE